MNMQGKVVVVTGAARGIGREYAVALGRAGASVLVCDVSDCAETADLVAQATQHVVATTMDVASSESTLAAAQLAVEKFGRIDGLVNNAALYGTLKGGRFDDIPEEEWDAAMAVNVKGVWNCCKAVVPAMRKSGGGSIVNISSLAATYGMPGRLHYTASKAAVIGLTRGLARELGRDLIRVNTVAPAAVMTEGTKEFFGGKVTSALDVIRSNQAIQKTLQVEDLAGAILYLLSDASKLVTGQTLSVDGGTIMH
ncbi:SDR family oxidoreductase [Verticiella sediminum]|uniref:SDR family oxidoreductase n=1 Tax=Verticiella sediminum TaxID=1247510 RepID=A0A556AII1_9BURK|nr:SDR family oxidoreductase [Verticiella sediminum]TSH92690.1 SDR family oxidoreductase [Verticiella sediminum]